jgi:hypothetical protein
MITGSVIFKTLILHIGCIPDNELYLFSGNMQIAYLMRPLARSREDDPRDVRTQLTLVVNCLKIHVFITANMSGG